MVNSASWLAADDDGDEIKNCAELTRAQPVCLNAAEGHALTAQRITFNVSNVGEQPTGGGEPKLSSTAPWLPGSSYGDGTDKTLVFQVIRRGFPRPPSRIRMHTDSGAIGRECSGFEFP